MTILFYKLKPKFLRRLAHPDGRPTCEKSRSWRREDDRLVLCCHNKSKLIYFCYLSGILTKPDSLQDGDTGSREAWKKTIAGEDPERKTKHGYYCVRLPNDLERKGGRDKAQSNAEEFFNSTTPWNRMKDRSRFGVPNFVQNISALLVELIEK